MLKLYGECFNSRLLLGTACYPSFDIMSNSIIASKTEIITVSLKRELNASIPNKFWHAIQALNKRILPNTAGCHYAKDAITTAEMAREIFQTNWVKLEVIGDQYTLQPDPFELVRAAAELTQRGFNVFPYCTEDLILCKRLLDVGCQVLMPWAAPIGSGKGIVNSYQLSVLRARLPDTPLIIDAGIGKPSHAAMSLELGFDAVLLNTAVAKSENPITMANAFRKAINAGRLAFESGMMAESEHAVPSTPVVDTPFWQQKDYANE